MSIRPFTPEELEEMRKADALMDRKIREIRQDPAERRREYNARYYEKNKARLLERRRKYYAENREKMIAYAKEWRKNNPEKARANCKRWYEKNKQREAIKNGDV